MNFIEDPKIMMGLAVLVFSVVIYFYINYQIENAVRAELVRVKKHKQHKLAKHAQLLKRQQYMQSRSGRDQDSYFDPADEEEMVGGNNEQDDQGDMTRSQPHRLTKDNILMRDMMM